MTHPGFFNISGSLSHRECNKDVSRDPDLNDIYKHFEIYRHVSRKENSVVLPPLTSRRENHFKTMDTDKLREKRYILKDKQASITKFERDEVFIPSVYNNHFNCAECRKLYVSKMFTKQYLYRNKRSPECSKSSDMAKEIRHYCDVLGKRSCGSCMEFENKTFSRSLHQNLAQKLTNNSHESHSRNRPRKRIGIDLRFASW